MGMDNLMKKETCPAVLGIYRRLRTRPYNNHYKRIAEHIPRRKRIDEKEQNARKDSRAGHHFGSRRLFFEEKEHYQNDEDRH